MENIGLVTNGENNGVGKGGGMEPLTEGTELG